MSTPKSKILLVLVFLFFESSLFAQENRNFSISGRVYFYSPGMILLYLVDGKESNKPLSGVAMEIIPDQNDLKTGSMTFEFQNIEPGTYGIRGFQDLNGNGKLDKGIFGPIEPWGASWNKQSPPDFPVFRDYSYRVNEDLRHIDVYLTE